MTLYPRVGMMIELHITLDEYRRAKVLSGEIETFFMPMTIIKTAGRSHVHPHGACYSANWSLLLLPFVLVCPIHKPLLSLDVLCRSPAEALSQLRWYLAPPRPDVCMQCVNKRYYAPKLFHPGGLLFVVTYFVYFLDNARPAG